MATNKETLEQSKKQLMEYLSLSKLLFADADSAPNDINELLPDNPFYPTARDIAEEMGLDWEKMSHEDSNRVMLNLLAEYYAAIQTDEDYIPILTITFQKKK